MIRRGVMIFLLVMGAAASIGCSANNPSTNEAQSSTTQADEDSDLQPADQALAEEADTEAIDGVIGDETDLGGGLSVTVNSIQGGGDNLGPWLEVDLRVENRGEDGNNPLVAIVCSDSSEEGGWQADSTFDLSGELPSDTFNEGTINLLLPGDSRTGETVPRCAEPAVVRVTPNSGYVVVEGQPPEQRPADFPIDATVLAQVQPS